MFRLGDEQPPSSRAPTALRSAPSLDALIALQTIQDNPQEKRRRAVKRGRGLLDALDELRLALFDGRADRQSLARLSGRLGEARDQTGDRGLDEALSAIDLRAAVELAKLGM